MRDVCFDMHKAQVNSRLSGGKLQPIARRPRWRKTAYLSGKQTECGDCRGSATYRGEGRDRSTPKRLVARLNPGRLFRAHLVHAGGPFRSNFLGLFLFDQAILTSFNPP